MTFIVHRIYIICNAGVVLRPEDNNRVICCPVQRIFKVMRQNAVFAEQETANPLNVGFFNLNFQQDAVVGVILDPVGRAVLQQAEISALQLVFHPMACEVTLPRLDVKELKVFAAVVDCGEVAAALSDVDRSGRIPGRFQQLIWLLALRAKIPRHTDPDGAFFPPPYRSRGCAAYGNSCAECFLPRSGRAMPVAWCT